MENLNRDRFFVRFTLVLPVRWLPRTLLPACGS